MLKRLLNRYKLLDKLCLIKTSLNKGTFKYSKDDSTCENIGAEISSYYTIKKSKFRITSM